MKKINDFLGFTLVELIVVITIVWILSTVWFVSYSGYLTWARDSNRISQITKLSDSLQVYAANKTLPLPDNYVEITESGALLAYQWEVGVDVLETIDYTNGWKDPKDDSYYTYYLTRDRNNIQLMAFMEEQQSIASILSLWTYAADYTDNFPKTYGKDLWVLTEPITNTPIQDVSAVVDSLDIQNTTDAYTMHVDGRSYTWTGSKLINLHYYYNLDRDEYFSPEEMTSYFWAWRDFFVETCSENIWEYIVVDAKKILETDTVLTFVNWDSWSSILYNWAYSWRLVLKCYDAFTFTVVLDSWEELWVVAAW